jgi:hypothetical protein
MLKFGLEGKSSARLTTWDWFGTMAMAVGMTCEKAIS